MMAPKIAKPTLLDRLVGYINPGAGLARVRDRTMLSLVTGQGGYHGGKRDRRATKNWRPGGGSANADLIPELGDLRARSRDLARNVPIATGSIATKKTHVIGDGLLVQAQCDRQVLGISEAQAQAFNRSAEREFALACKTADYTKVQHFNDMQALIFGGALESGDIFVVRRWRLDPGDTYGTKLQVVEGDRVCNPFFGADTETLVAGIEHLSSGVPVAVHIADRHPGDIRMKVLSWRRVPMRYNDGSPIVLHVFNRLRPDQARGIPYLAPVIEALKSLGDYTEAEVRAAVVSAMFTVFVKNAPDAESGPLPSEDSGGGKPEEMKLGPGAILDLAEGEDVVVANPGRPNPQFGQFTMDFLRQIGVGLELPFELLVKHFTASYTAGRAALELAWHAFRRDRNWFARRTCQPFYEWIIEEAILLGRLSAPGFFDDPLIREAWLRSQWTGPVRISIDPKKEAEADKLDVDNGFKTNQQVMTERTGGDFEQKIEQLGREQKAKKAAGLGAAAPKPDALPTRSDEDDPETVDEEA